MNYFRYIPRSGIPGSHGNSMFKFSRNCETSPQWLPHFIFQSVMYEGSNFSKALPIFVIFYFLITVIRMAMKWYICESFPLRISLLHNKCDFLYIHIPTLCQGLSSKAMLIKSQVFQLVALFIGARKNLHGCHGPY